MALTEWLRRELFSGWSRFEAGWLLFFSADSDGGVFSFQPDSIAATIAAVSGVLCVVFVGKGKISNYFFGLISVSLYAYVALQLIALRRNNAEFAGVCAGAVYLAFMWRYAT